MIPSIPCLANCVEASGLIEWSCRRRDHCTLSPIVAPVSRLLGPVLMTRKKNISLQYLINHLFYPTLKPHEAPLSGYQVRNYASEYKSLFKFGCQVEGYLVEGFRDILYELSEIGTTAGLKLRNWLAQVFRFLVNFFRGHKNRPYPS